MGNLSLFKIRGLALDSGRSVFSMQQLSALIDKPKVVCSVYASRLVSKGLALRVGKGKISFENDVFIVASQLIEPSYISLNSALLFHGLISQVQKNVECVNTRNSFNFNNLGIVYHKIPTSLFFGFKKYKKGSSYVLVADPEKAVVDGLYLNIFSEENLVEFLSFLDLSKLNFFINNFNGRGKKKLLKLVKND